MREFYEKKIAEMAKEYGLEVHCDGLLYGIWHEDHGWQVCVTRDSNEAERLLIELARLALEKMEPEF